MELTTFVGLLASAIIFGAAGVFGTVYYLRINAEKKKVMYF